jgi:molecular chaperone DnaK
MATDNKSLGRFILDGIPPAPRGVPQIEVTFDIDADGILNVSAKDKATEREQSMQIIPSSGLSDEEVEQMVHDAELHREQDRQRQDLAEARNVADTTAYSAEKFLGDLGDQLAPEIKEGLEKKLREVREAIPGDNLTQLRKLTQELNEGIQSVGAKMYEGAGPGTPPPAADSRDSDEDVIDGEFTADE